MARVWELSPLKAERLLIHLAIADHMDHDGYGFVSWSQIQAKTKAGRTTIYEAVREMERLGFLRVVEAHVGKFATRYQLLWPRLPEQRSDGSPTEPCDGSAAEPVMVQPPNGSAAEPADLMVRLSTSDGSANTSDGSAAGNSSVPTSVHRHPSSRLSSANPPPSCPHSDECRQAANLLALLITANGSKPPTITCRWHTDLDRLHRIDGRAWPDIEAAIRWSQADPFWRANILSPAKLRAKYDQLRLAAMRPTRSHNGSKTRHALSLADRMEEAEHAALTSAQTAHPSLAAGPHRAARQP